MRLFTSWVQLRHRLTGLVGPSVRQLDHVTVPCCDLDIAEKFYVGVLGARIMLRVDEAFLKRVGRPAEEAAAARHTSVLFSGGARIDLFHQREGQPLPLAGHPHYAFKVRPPRALLQWRRRLAAHGIPTFGPTRLGPPG
jgi:catechol 2,3-dioxygenase-like lactoylglutathione lyase family enzyme